MSTQLPKDEKDLAQRLEIAYIAGLMDGEGYFGIKKQTHLSPNYRDQLCVSVSMTDRDSVERVAQMFPAKRGRVRCYPPRGENEQPYYLHSLVGDSAEALMRAVLPFVSSRRAAKIRACLATPNLSHTPRVTHDVV